MQHAKDYGLVAEKIGADLDAVVKRSRGVAKQLNQGVTHLMKKNKITVHMGDRQADRRAARSRSTGDKGKESSPPRTSSSRPARARATCRSRQGRRQAHLDLSPRDGAARDADQAAGDRIGRDRDRVRQLLQGHGRRGDGGRDARPDRAGRGCRRLRLPRKGAQEAGHDDHDQGRRREARGRRAGRQGDDQGQGRQGRRRPNSATSSSRSASCPTPRISGWRRWASKMDRGFIKTEPRLQDQRRRASTRSATSPRRPGWRTRRATRA